MSAKALGGAADTCPRTPRVNKSVTNVYSFAMSPTNQPEELLIGKPLYKNIIIYNLHKLVPMTVVARGKAADILPDFHTLEQTRSESPTRSKIRTMSTALRWASTIKWVYLASSKRLWNTLIQHPIQSWNELKRINANRRVKSAQQRNKPCNIRRPHLNNSIKNLPKHHHNFSNHKYTLWSDHKQSHN